MSQVDLRQLVEERMAELLIQPGLIKELPKCSETLLEKRLRRRVSVVTFVEADDDGIRVIIKAFQYGFFGLWSNAVADGFRLDLEGRVQQLTQGDIDTLY